MGGGGVPDLSLTGAGDRLPGIHPPVTLCGGWSGVPGGGGDMIPTGWRKMPGLALA